jgi:amino acid transporter
VVARLCAYIGTTLAVLVLRKRHGHREDALKLPGGPLIPLGALVLSIGLLASATLNNLIAGACALLLGAVIYLMRRRDAS